MTEAMVAALAGSRGGDGVVVDVWYGGELTAAELPVGSWGLGWERSRQVQCQGTVTVVDADGSLAPWSVDDTLGVAGPVAHVKYQLAGGEVSLGWFRVTGAAVAQTWRAQRLVRPADTARSAALVARAQGRVDAAVASGDAYRIEVTREVLARAERDHYDTGVAAVGGGVLTDHDPVWSSTATVTLQVDDLMVQVALSDFLGNETARKGGTVLSEVKRLCRGLVIVEVHPSVVDGDIPATITYEGTRIGTVIDLLASIDAEPRMTGEGTMMVIPSTAGVPVWDIAPGDDGVLVDFSRSYDTAELVNTVVVSGRAEEDVTLLGVARAESGPLSVHGPHGTVTASYSGDILNTQSKVQRAAEKYLRRATTDRTLALPVTCLPHPGLQVGDVVRLLTPAGPLTGPVASMSLAGGEASTAPMSLSMDVPLSDAQAVGEALARGRAR